MEQWRIAFGTISPFEKHSGTGNQNYAVNLDLALTIPLALIICTAKLMTHSMHH